MRPRDVVAIAFAVSTVTALGLIAALAVVVPRLVETENARGAAGGGVPGVGRE